jgi:hypothetical protein
MGFCDFGCSFIEKCDTKKFYIYIVEIFLEFIAEIKNYFIEKVLRII